MMFRNSYRLLLANFGTFWKDLLYKIIVIVCVLLATWPAFSIISSLDNYSQILLNFENLILTFPFANMPVYFADLFAIVQLILTTVGSLFTLHTLTAVYLTVLYVIVLPFFLSLSTLAVSEVLYGTMSSQTKYGFSASFIKKIGKSSVYAIFSTLITIPFASLTLYALYLLLLLFANGSLSVIVLPFLMLVVAIGIYGFKITLFSGWAPSIIVFNCGVFRGMGKGMIAVFRRFFKSFSTVAMILLISILFGNIFGFVSIILVLPILAMTVVIFRMVMFFGSQGMRYYVDPDTILCPKKLEETDKFKRVKNII